MKNKILLAIASFTIVVSLVGCGTSSGMSAVSDSFINSPEYGYSEEMKDESAAMDSNGATDAVTDGQSTVGSEYSQKLIKTYDLNFETKNFNKSKELVSENVSKFGGYIESSDTYGNTGYKSVNYILRIPADKIDEFLTDCDGIGEMTSSSESAKDITLTYYDTASKIESLNKQKTRLNELLDQAATLSDIIEIEDKLEEVESEIESYGTQMKVYDNLIDYCTVNLSFNEVNDISTVSDDGFFTRIAKGFTSNTHSLFSFIENAIVYIITIIPYLIFIGVIGIVVLICVKKHKKNKENKKE